MTVKDFCLEVNLAKEEISKWSECAPMLVVSVGWYKQHLSKFVSYDSNKTTKLKHYEFVRWCDNILEKYSA
jgi:hypothetical protein